LETKCDMGKRNNQNFVSVPFEKLISMIQYKAEELPIFVRYKQEGNLFIPYNTKENVRSGS